MPCKFVHPCPNFLAISGTQRKLGVLAYTYNNICKSVPRCFINIETRVGHTSVNGGGEGGGKETSLYAIVFNLMFGSIIRLALCVNFQLKWLFCSEMNMNAGGRSTLSKWNLIN